MNFSSNDSDDLELLLNDSTSSSDENEGAGVRRRPRVFRLRPDYLNYFEDIDFKVRFRLSKGTVEHILSVVGGQLLPATNRNNPVTPSQQLLLTLRFYALGSMLQAAGDFTGVSKSTACLVVWKVTKVIASMRATYINMNGENLDHDFYSIARFPKVIGAIGCTHVRIQSPGGEQAETYRNHKGNFSLNVQAVCDAKLNIKNIVARWPGSAHNATIFNNSSLKGRFEGGEFGDKTLVGDSGYPRKMYLRKPLNNPATEVERLYNESQISTRNCIERCFSVWKRRFPVLFLPLRLSLYRVEGVIVATAVLHNIARKENEDDYPMEGPEPQDQDQQVPAYEEIGQNVDDEFLIFINTYF